MIYQLYNHPSVCWWGLFNEIDYPETSASNTIFNQLNDMAHEHGGNRLTTSASNKGKRYYNGITDAPAWNNYPGWYWMLRWPKEENNKGRMDGFSKWIDYRSVACCASLLSAMPLRVHGFAILPDGTVPAMFLSVVRVAPPCGVPYLLQPRIHLGRTSCPQSLRSATP